MDTSQLRNLPSVERVVNSSDLTHEVTTYGRDWLVELARKAVDDARQLVMSGAAAPPLDAICRSVKNAVQELVTPSPRPVINATGVVIHTNLGRAPLSRAALAAANAAGKGYSDLEIDLATGRRGSRQAHLQSLLQQITGAEAALVVNNNASALLLGLSALASGREVVVSRGEAVEIGGGFRIPDVLRQSGCHLVDVGTTNRTYVRDYADATTENTGAFLKAHASNFRVEGFTAAVDERELVELGNRSGVPVLHDVGSGSLLPTERYGLAHEPTPQESIAAGVGLVFFSGDKLLGGPQAGIVVGKRDLVSRLERHPLARAVRIDKMSLASLTATLTHYLLNEAEIRNPGLANDLGCRTYGARPRRAMAVIHFGNRCRGRGGAGTFGHRRRKPPRRDFAILGFIAIAQRFKAKPGNAVGQPARPGHPGNRPHRRRHYPPRSAHRIA